MRMYDLKYLSLNEQIEISASAAFVVIFIGLGCFIVLLPRELLQPPRNEA